MIDLYLVTIVSFCLGASGSWLMSKYAFSLGLIDIPNTRSSHTLPVPRGGGVGILVAFTISAIFLRLPLGIWAGATGLAVLSFFDDRLDLSPKVRIVFQFLAAAITVVAAGIHWFPLSQTVLLSFWIVWIVATANFYNFMDGINGIAGITGTVGFSLAAGFGSASGGPQPVILIALGFACACLGFLPFNFPRARVFMGDVGSILLGFFYAVITLLLARDLAGFLCFVGFMLPFYVDAVSTIFIRWRDGEKLSQAHRRHLYQILANEKRIPHSIVTLAYGGVQLVTGWAMLAVWHLGILWQVGLLLIISAVFLLFSAAVRAAIRCGSA